MKNLLIISAFLLLAGACFGNRKVGEIEVSELLLIAAKEQNTDYCSLLKGSINGNCNDIRRLALLDFHDGAGYDHGAILVKLIGIIGEDMFIQSISGIGNEKKQEIKNSIAVGLEYGDNSDLNKLSIEQAFPKLFFYLNQ